MSQDQPHSRREFFDAVASDWEGQDFSEGELEKVDRLHERLGPLDGMTVLEPGCGTGRLTHLLSQWVGPDGKVIAVDNSPRMFEAARRTTAASGPQVELHCRDAELMPVPEGALDLALLFCVFPHFQDKALALRCFAGMLKHSGRLVIAHLSGSEQLNLMHEGAGEPVRKDRIPAHPVLTAMIEGAGLRLCALIDEPEEFYLEAVPCEPGRPSSFPEGARG